MAHFVFGVGRTSAEHKSQVASLDIAGISVAGRRDPSKSGEVLLEEKEKNKKDNEEAAVAKFAQTLKTWQEEKEKKKKKNQSESSEGVDSQSKD